MKGITQILEKQYKILHKEEVLPTCVLLALAFYLCNAIIPRLGVYMGTQRAELGPADCKHPKNHCLALRCSVYYLRIPQHSVSLLSISRKLAVTNLLLCDPPFTYLTFLRFLAYIPFVANSPNPIYNDHL